MHSRRFLAPLAVSAICCAAFAQPSDPNLTYAVVAGRPLMLDLYRPAGQQGRTPCVIWIHGGGWSGGSRAGIPQHCQLLRQMGFAVASVDYRLTSQAGQWGGESVTFPAQINDVKAAVRWLRANAAQFNLDPNRFGSSGSSAGGHLSALLGMSGDVAELEGAVGEFDHLSSRTQVCSDFFGPTDLFMMNPDVTEPPGSNINHDAPSSPESRLIGFDDANQGLGVLRDNRKNPDAPFPFYVQLADWASPLTWIDPTDPETFIAHGEQDMSVPFHQSERLQAALGAAGVFSEFRINPTAGHGGLGGAIEQAAAAFIFNHLRCRPDFDRDGFLTGRDFDLFVQAFEEGRGFTDMDFDGFTTGADFDRYVQLFLIGC